MTPSVCRQTLVRRNWEPGNSIEEIIRAAGFRVQIVPKSDRRGRD